VKEMLQIELWPKIVLWQTGALVSEDVCEQAEQCVKNLGAVLAAAGGSYQDSKFPSNL